MTPELRPPQRRNQRRIWLARLVAIVALTLVAAACSDEPIPIAVPAEPAAAGETAAQPAAPTAAPIVATSDSTEGEILVNAEGLSLYGFTNDTDGTSACFDGCAQAWPPVLVDGALPDDLDPEIFSVVARPDGTNQLKAGKWPLYLFAGDTAPGQTTGHLSGDVWFLAAPDGSLIDAPSSEPAADVVEESAAEAPAAEEVTVEAPVAPVSVGSTELGDVLVNEDGLTLYGFTNDVDGVSVCEGGCAEAWPPVLVDGGALPADLDPSIFSVSTRPDGSNQLNAGVWPLYLFAGDTAPGQTTGHLSGDVWFVVAPDGTLIDDPAVETEASEADEPVAEAAEADNANPGYGTSASSDETEAAVAVAAAASERGDILVDQAGLSLYGFTNDTDGQSACFDGCAEAWPPLLVPSADLPADLDANLFSVISRGDGTWQLKAGIWPLYRFAGDTSPGQTTGHLSGDVWFLVAPDAKLVDFVPAPAVQPAEPAAPAEPAPTATPAPAPTATPAPAPTPTVAPSTDGYGDDGAADSDYGSSDY